MGVQILLLHMSTQEKLHRLEKIVRNPSEDDLFELDKLQKEISQKERYKDFLEHPITKEIVGRLVVWLKDATMLLLSEKSIKEGERLKCIIRKHAIEDLLSIFSPDKVGISSVEDFLDVKIRSYEEYYGKVGK